MLENKGWISPKSWGVKNSLLCEKDIFRGVLGNHDVAIEVKSSNKISERNLKGVKSFSEEYKVKHLILVCNEPLPRLHNHIWILLWKIFL